MKGRALEALVAFEIEGAAAEDANRANEYGNDEPEGVGDFLRATCLTAGRNLGKKELDMA